jgi:hypothetical protein
MNATPMAQNVLNATISTTARLPDRLFSTGLHNRNAMGPSLIKS